MNLGRGIFGLFTERKTEDSSLTMTKTIKEEVQEAMLRERNKTALIVRGVPENGKDREAIRHIPDTLEMTEERST